MLYNHFMRNVLTRDTVTTDNAVTNASTSANETMKVSLIAIHIVQGRFCEIAHEKPSRIYAKSATIARSKDEMIHT